MKYVSFFKIKMQQTNLRKQLKEHLVFNKAKAKQILKQYQLHKKCSVICLGKFISKKF